MFDQDAINGRMFVTEDPITVGGDPSIEDYLNQDSDMFFPFERDSGTYRLINKQLLTFIHSTQDDRL